MFRLSVLGPPSLADVSGTECRSVLSQPKRLAVLAYLAIEGSSGFVRRDALLAIFWPESTGDAARQALRQTLYHLRRALGDDVFASRAPDELAIDRQVLWCDAVAFHDAVTEQRFADAMAAYGGELLPTFAFAGQAPEFEHWLERARSGFRDRAANAARRLSDDAVDHGSREDASRWARRAAELAPDNESLVRRAMQVLAAGGDRGGAMHIFAELSRRLRTEFQTRPSAETSALAEQIGRGTGEHEIRTRLAVEGAAEKSDPPVPSLSAGAAPPPDVPAPPAIDRITPAGPRGDTPAVPHVGFSIVGRARRSNLVAAVLALAAVLVLAWTVAARRPPGSGADTPTLAVLPFDGPADGDEGYVAGTIGDEIRARLAGLSGLRVIAGASSNQYKSMGARRVGSELGAQYLLTGRVIVEGQGETMRVHVTPELIRASDATVTWTAPYAATPHELADIQGRVAAAVTQALHVRLDDSARASLARAPTHNAAAYQAYLRGLKRFNDGSANAGTLPGAVAELERAVALDTMFADAWAALSQARTRLFQNGGTVDSNSALLAGDAARRALALDSTLAPAYAALASYYAVAGNDPALAMRTLQAGLRKRPHDYELLLLVALGERGAGNWHDAERHFHEAMAADPLGGAATYDYAMTLLVLRRPAEALPVAQRALGNGQSAQEWQLLAMLHLVDGDLTGARAVMTRAGGLLDPTDLTAFMASQGDLYWALDDAQRALLKRLTPAPFGGDRFNWSFALAGQFMLDGDTVRARAFADTARVIAEENVRQFPNDGQEHVLLGLLDAFLGRREDAVREGERGVALLPISADAMSGPYVLEQLAHIYELVGDDEHAVAALRRMLGVPYYVTAAWLRIDPNFAPLRRRSAAFRQLIGST